MHTLLYHHPNRRDASMERMGEERMGEDQTLAVGNAILMTCQCGSRKCEIDVRREPPPFHPIQLFCSLRIRLRSLSPHRQSLRNPTAQLSVSSFFSFQPSLPSTPIRCDLSLMLDIRQHRPPQIRLDPQPIHRVHSPHPTTLPLDHLTTPWYR